jgi:hypothetical protein
MPLLRVCRERSRHQAGELRQSHDAHVEPVQPPLLGLLDWSARVDAVRAAAAEGNPHAIAWLVRWGLATAEQGG